MAEETRVEIALPSDVDRNSMASIVRELLGFVLYMHHQMPCTFDQLKLELSSMEKAIAAEAEDAAAKRHSRQMLPKLRKLRKFQASVDGFMLVLEQTLFRTPGIGRLMLLIGSSVVRPQVIYTLHLVPAALTDDGSASELDVASKVNQFSRKMIRELISHDVGEPLAGPSKVFLLVEAPADAVVTEDFLPKRNFACKSHKVKRVSLHLLPQGNSAAVVDNAKDKIWFQCRHSFRGLPSD